jgi:hypothetical protein
VTSIVVGQSITFNVVIPLDQVPLFNGTGFDSNGNPTTGFAGGGARFSSGDGQTQLTASIGPFGGGGITFTYLIPGDYVASVSGDILYHTCTPFGCLPNGGGGLGSQSFFATENISVGVPEPATWAMMLLGFAGLGFAFRQSRRKASFA